MVDFNNLMSDGQSDCQTDPIAIFEELPKSNRINDLYNIQGDILRQWYNRHLHSKDVVIELSTGGGKTLVGLLIALSIMRETGEGVLYLVENRQLAEQVAEQAKDLEIAVRTYQGRESVNADFDNGKTILIGSYQALFNGLSVFGLRGSDGVQALGGIIVDDAHASLRSIREAFTLKIPADCSGGLYKKILAEFRDAFDDIERSSTFQELMQGIGGDVVEIPYWSWLEKSEYIAGLISKEHHERRGLEDSFSNDLVFHWPLLKDNLKYCQVIASRTGITIAALYPIVDMIPSFANAKSRVFMSATITDYGDIIRAYDLRGIDEESVIAPKTVVGVGRRMILDLPKEISQSNEYAGLVKEIFNEGCGVVRFVSRKDTDVTCSSIEFDEPMGHDDVQAAVLALQNGDAKQPVSFVNRYNGIDLPGDSCRLLIMRGLPVGESDHECLMSVYLDDSELRTQRLAQRIEQGLGRGTRGASDHCVVLLEGNDLIDWVKRDRNRKYFTPALRTQLQMGEKIQGELKTPKEYCDAIRQDLCDEDSWKKYHAMMLAKAVSEDAMSRFGASCDVARAERKAFACWMEHRYDKSHEVLAKAANLSDVDRSYKGWLFHLASRIAFDGGNKALADEYQQSAHSFNRSMPYFPFPLEADYPTEAYEQASVVIAVSQIVENRNRAVSKFDRDTADLNADASNNEFENALMKLGKYIGFESERKDDNGDGPDVYWISPDGIGFAIEAKNEKGDGTPLHKDEAGQLRTARDWMNQHYPGIEVFPISVHPCKESDRNASAANLYVLTLESIEVLKEEVRMLIAEAARHTGSDLKSFVAKNITHEGLSAKSILERHTTLYAEANPKH